MRIHAGKHVGHACLCGSSIRRITWKYHTSPSSSRHIVTSGYHANWTLDPFGGAGSITAVDQMQRKLSGSMLCLYELVWPTSNRLLGRNPACWMSSSFGCQYQANLVHDPAHFVAWSETEVWGSPPKDYFAEAGVPQDITINQWRMVCQHFTISVWGRYVSRAIKFVHSVW